MTSVGRLFVWGEPWGGELRENEDFQGRQLLQLAGGGSNGHDGVAIVERPGRVWWAHLGSFLSESSANASFDLPDARSTVTSCVLGRQRGMVATEDQVFGVGANEDGGLGTGDRRDRLDLAPLKKLNGQQVVNISAGEAHAAAVTADGRLYAWGRLNPARAGRVAVPQLVSALDQSPVRAVACGADFSLVVLRDGRLLSWGRGSLGQLGLGKVTQVDTPQVVADRDVQGRPFTAVAAGWAHGMALTDAGALYTFGFNAKGQLGLGDTATRFAPERVTRFCAAGGVPADPRQPAAYTVENGPVQVARIAAGRHHSAAIDTSGVVLAWGSNRGNRAVPAPEPAAAAGDRSPDPRQAAAEEGSKEPARDRARALVRGNLRSRPAAAPISPFARYHMASDAAVAGRDCPSEASAAVAGVSRTRTLPRDSAALILLPKQVSHPLLGDLKAAEIACGETSTACFTPAALEQVEPGCAIVDSGRLLRLTGRGIRSVAAMAPSVAGADRDVVGASAGVPGLLGDGHGPDTLELADGSPEVLGVPGGVLVAVPGCVARFTRPERPELLAAATARRRRARELAATLGASDPLGDEEEPDEEDDIDSVAEEEAAVMVRYAPVYAAPSSSGHGDALFAPVAPFPSACDLVVQVLLRALGVDEHAEDAWETVSGAVDVIACSPPVVEAVQPPSLPLVPGPTVKLSGPGLWSWMKADPIARQRAVELEQAAEEQVVQRERLEARVMELELLVRRWNEAEVAGEDLEGMPPPGERAQVRRDAAAAAEELASLPPLRLRVTTKPDDHAGGGGGSGDSGGEEGRALDSPFEGEAEVAAGGALLRFLVETTLGGEPVAQSGPVAGWFTAEFLEKELLEEGGGGGGGLGGGDEEDSMGGVEAGEGDDGLEKLLEPPGKYVASLSAPLPRMDLPRGVSDADLTLAVELSLDGGATWTGTGPAGRIVAFECQPAAIGPPVLALDGSIRTHVLEVAGSGLAPLPSARLRLLLHPFGPDGDGVVPLEDPGWEPAVFPVEPPMDGDDVEELSRLLAAVDAAALREHPAVQAAVEAAAGDAVVVGWEAELSMDGQTFEPIPFPDGEGHLQTGAGAFHGLLFLARADGAESLPVDAALGSEVPILIRGPPAATPAGAAAPIAEEEEGGGGEAADGQDAAAAAAEEEEEEGEGAASTALATFLVEQSAALGSLRVRAAVGQQELPVTAAVSSGGLILQLPALRSAAAGAAAAGAEDAEAEGAAGSSGDQEGGGGEEGVVRVEGAAPWHVEVMVSVDGGGSTLGQSGDADGCTARIVAYDKSGLTLGAVGPKKLKPSSPLTVEVAGCERLGCSRPALDGMEWLVAIGRDAEALAAAAEAGEAVAADDPRQGCRLPGHITAPAADVPIDESLPVTLEVMLPAAGAPGPDGGPGLPVNATTVSVSMDGGATWLAGSVGVKLAKK